MATRTQKAAMKKKADAEKADRAKARAAKEEALDFEAQRAMDLLDAEAAKDKKAGKAKAGKPGRKAKSEAPDKAATPAKAGRKPKAEAPAKAATPAKPQKGTPAVEFADETPGQEKPGFLARWRAAREERAKVREAEAERRAAARTAEEARLAVERAETEEKARKEAEERAAAEAAAAAAAEKERKRQQRRAAAQEAKRQAEMAAAIKEAEANARREERRLQRQAERAAIDERERQAAEAAEAADRLREAQRQAAAQEKADATAAKMAKAAAGKEAAAATAAEPEQADQAELEPEMEFQEGAKPVDPSRALVPAKDEAKGKGKDGKEGTDRRKDEPASAVDTQADKVAEELARRRSKPVVIVEDEETPVPRIPKAKREEPEEPLVLSEAVVDEKYQPAAPAPPPPAGLSIPEMFILVANEGSWDERAEKAKPGRLGGALIGAVFLELLQRGRLLVQRDRFTVVGEPGDDAAVEEAVARVRSLREKKGDISSLPHMRRAAKWNRELLEPFKDRLAGRGLVRHGHRMHLGLFYRSSVELLDQDAQERLQNKLRRAIAGGGTPEASSILLLGLLDACGRLETIVPDEAMDYNRKRLNGLLAGRDVMGYKVDPQLKGLQEVAIRTILQNVRLMTVA